MKALKYFIHFTTFMMVLGGIVTIMESSADLYTTWAVVGYVIASAYIEINEKK